MRLNCQHLDVTNMKNLLKYLILIFFIVNVLSASANKGLKPDTVYFSLDTANVPLNDRMVIIEDAAPLNFIQLAVPAFPTIVDLT